MKTVSPLRAILAVAWKDLQVIFKDRGFLVVVLFLPAVFSMLFGTINQRNINQSKEPFTFPVALVNQDRGAYGQQIAAILGDLQMLKLSTLSSPEAAEEGVLSSQYVAAILIPDGLSQQVDNYQPSKIMVMVDPTQEQYGQIVTGIMNEVITPVVLVGELSHGIRSILAEYAPYQAADANIKRAFEAQSLAANMAEVEKMRSDPWIKMTTITTGGEEVVLVPDNIFGMIVPSFTVMFAFFIVGTLGADLLKERQEGTLRRLMAAPMPRWAVILGKMLAFLFVVIVQVALIFGGASLVFDMPLGDSLPGLLLVTLAMGLAATGLGMMVAALARSDRQADTIGLLLGFILAGLGGCFVFGAVPLYKSGGTMETISRLTPHAHALIAYDKLLVGGQGLMAVLPEVGILLLFSALFFGVAVWRFRYE